MNPRHKRTNMTLVANASMFTPNQRLGVYIANIVLAIFGLGVIAYLIVAMNIEIDAKVLFASITALVMNAGGGLLAATNIGTKITHPADMPFTNRTGLDMPPPVDETTLPPAPILDNHDVLPRGDLTGDGMPPYGAPAGYELDPVGALTDSADDHLVTIDQR